MDKICLVVDLAKGGSVTNWVQYLVQRTFFFKYKLDMLHFFNRVYFSIQKYLEMNYKSFSNHLKPEKKIQEKKVIEYGLKLRLPPTPA